LVGLPGFINPKRDDTASREPGPQKARARKGRARKGRVKGKVVKRRKSPKKICCSTRVIPQRQKI
jgi:hypothetical protein